MGFDQSKQESNTLVGQTTCAGQTLMPRPDSWPYTLSSKQVQCDILSTCFSFKGNFPLKLFCIANHKILTVFLENVINKHIYLLFRVYSLKAGSIYTMHFPNTTNNNLLHGKNLMCIYQMEEGELRILRKTVLCFTDSCTDDMLSV